MQDSLRALDILLVLSVLVSWLLLSSQIYVIIDEKLILLNLTILKNSTKISFRSRNRDTHIWPFTNCEFSSILMENMFIIIYTSMYIK